jgi:hypothetical protein
VVPIFEHLPIRRLQFMKHLGRIIRHAGPKHMMMCPLHHRDGIHLHITQVLNGAQHAWFSDTKGHFLLRKPLRAQRDQPGFGQANLILLAGFHVKRKEARFTSARMLSPAGGSDKTFCTSKRINGS